MKKNKKVIFMALFLIVLIPLFAGCDDPYAIKFINYIPNDGALVDSNSENGHVYFEVSFGKAWEEEDYYFNVTGPGDISVGVKGKGVPKFSPSGRGTCYSVSEYLKMSSKDLPITVNINNVKKYVKAFNKPFDYQLTIYEDNKCSKVVAKNSTRNFSFSIISDDLDPASLSNVIEKIGGKSQYCNVDSNGNYRKLNTDNLFVAVAYSQMGYEYLHSGKESGCTGINYSKVKLSGKYGSSLVGEEADLNFINWVAKKTGVTLQKFNNRSSLLNWAKSNNRFYTSANKMHEADLMVGESSVGILYKGNFGWQSIGVKWLATSSDGNDLYGVWDTLDGEFRATGQYISLKGIAY